MIHRASLLLLLSVGCFKAGGGGSNHNPPPYVQRGAPQQLVIRMSAVYEDGPMDRRFTEITVHFRLAEARQYSALPMQTRNLDDKHLEASVELPPFPSNAAGPLEYYFEFKFDGHPNRHGTPEKPQRVELCDRNACGNKVAHVTPSHFARGLPRPVAIEVSVGSDLGPIEHRVTLVSFHYRAADEAKYRTLRMPTRVVADRRIEAFVDLPPFPKEAQSPVEYYFSYTLDGKPATYGTPEKPIQVQLFDRR